MRHFGLIGLPLQHSFSKKHFSAKFAVENIDAAYHLYELQQIGDLKQLIQDTELSGLNVTIPYKEEVISLLDELDETAAAIGAVNVIKFIRNHDGLKLKGYNTDVVGFELSLKPYLQAHHRKALILGTGGASKAINYSLRQLGIETCYVSRTEKPGMLTYQQLNPELMSQYQLIVNTSPVGTFPHADECPDIPYQHLSSQHLLFDLVYNPAETLFLKKGKQQGAACLNGQAMLVGQAEAAWDIWNM